MVEKPQPNWVAEMKGLLGTDPSRFNRRPKLFGHLFSGRSKSLIVDGSGSGYRKRGKTMGQAIYFSPSPLNSLRLERSGRETDRKLLLTRRVGKGG